MKKWLLRISAVVALIFLALAILVLWTDADETFMANWIRNEKLETIKADWNGTPIDKKGRFVNDEFPFLPKALALLKWQTSRNPFKAEKEADTHRLAVRDPTAFLNSETDGILWLGHASFFIRLDGKGILIDPIFGTPPLVTRFIEVPSPLEKIRRVDYVLLSHDHRDHMDETTLRQIAEKFPDAIFLAGLGSEDVLTKWKTATNEVRTAGWYQQFDTGKENLRVFFVPVRHWSRRGLFDTNKRLWGGFVIQSSKAAIYFGGDSGYGRHYREVGELFPQVDYFLIGIGAYEPRWFMEPVHNSPGDALKAFFDSGAKKLIPMHYGTFDLSDEPPNTPLKALKAEAEKLGLSDRITTLTINESLEIPN
ncbi:MAG: MBL fold metallo-hydrolase [Pyrinomonadaceae bacterium]